MTTGVEAGGSDGVRAEVRDGVRGMRRAPAVAIAAALLVGCGGSDRADRSVADAPEVPERAAVEVLSIGTAGGDGAAAFGSVTDAVLDATGRIYVADGQAGRVRVFDADGVHLFDAGRRGQGPGELLQPCCLAFDDAGRLWVRDGGNGRYTAFLLHGRDSATFSDQRRMPHGDGNRRTSLGFRGDSLVDAGLRSETVRTERGTSMRTLGLHRVYVPAGEGEPRWEKVEELSLEETGARSVTRATENERTTVYVYPLFGREQRVAHGPDGRWAEMVTDAYRITVHDPDGGSRILEAATPPSPPLSDADRAAAEPRLAAYRRMLGADFPEELAELPPGKPPLRDLFFDADGRLWVELAVSGGEPRVAELWTPHGERVERRVWPPDVAIEGGHGVRGDTALGVRTDSLGVQRVVRLEWPAGG